MRIAEVRGGATYCLAHRHRTDREHRADREVVTTLLHGVADWLGVS